MKKQTSRMTGFKNVVGLTALALFLAQPCPATAQNATGPLPDPDPEAERQSFIVADGFEVNLYAADPLIAKPIQMNFDAEGRLWLATSEVYPQIKPGQEANDKVLILEDKDGDGVAETTTVFADGLLIPTGIEPGDGGAYVANSTELLHLKDTNGDGKADSTRVVLSGFGTEDTHHLLHTLRWGHDGMLYMNQSVYIHSHIETPKGVRRLNAGGVWRFRPESMDLDVFIKGLWNPWGHQVDQWGQSFLTDGAGNEGINYALPGGSYAMADGASRILKGLNPGSPKYSGLEIVDGRHLPESWRGNLITNDFRGNRVCRFVVSDDGAGFASRERAELIKSSQVVFRPIDVKMGPDGAIYIADWYNPIIQHGEVDFRDPRRDQTRGRIWRVTAKGRPLVERPKLVGADVHALLEALKAPESFTRHHAKRVLKERGAAEVVPALAAWIKGLDSADSRSERHRLEGLWTYQSLDVVEPDLLSRLLESDEPNARAAAVRVVQFWWDRLTDPLELLAPRVVDENPRVRLEAVRVLAHFPSEEASALALRALDKPIDDFLDYALWLTARELAPTWLPAARDGRFDFEDNPRRLVFALESVGTADVLKPLLDLYQSGRVPADRDESAMNLIAKLGGPDELAPLFGLVERGEGLSSARRAALLAALVRAGRERGVVPSGDLSGLGRLLDNSDPEVRAAAASAVGAWKVSALQPRLVELARDVDADHSVRREVIVALLDLGDSESVRVVEELAGTGDDRALPLAVLADRDSRAAAPLASEWLEGLSADRADDVQRVLGRFLERKGGPEALAKALEGTKLDADLAKLAVRSVQSSGKPAGDLIRALSESGGLGSTSRVYSDAEKASILAELPQGDPARGEAIFRRDELTCLKCHAIAGAGGLVGPGLESIGASAPDDYLLDSLLEPNKAVKENYHSTIVATDDGRIITGIQVRQSDSELVLRDAEDHEITIPLDAIEEQQPTGSLMPDGLTDSLTQAELVDLVRFLSELGKIGPYSVGQDRVLRTWRALESTPEAATAMIRSSPEAVIQARDSWVWRPVYATVAGFLPPEELPTNPRANAPAMTLVQSAITVTTPGTIKLRFNSTAELSFWIDGRRVQPDPNEPDALVLDLDRGTHNLFVAYEPSGRTEPIRCVLEDAPGSAAQARPELGK